MNLETEVVVIGGGHAGAEAAWVCARLGVPTVLVTMDRRAIGRMSCNPAMGGIGKGQMIREIDALGGLMGLASDAAGIHFRILNRRKGPAVRAPRAQCDRTLYADAVQKALASTPNLMIIEGTVEGIDVERSSDHGRPAVRGVRLKGGDILHCLCAIVTTGTFLRAVMHTGERITPGGRLGEDSADGLSSTLAKLGLTLARLKTGTPPRVACDSVDYAALEIQTPDETPAPFSFMHDGLDQQQVPCWITYTNEETHALIRADLHRAPLYTGQISSTGPRYCPSIEDKIVRFSEKPRHQVFLEPEGYESDRLYCNGISTSLPEDVQVAMVRSIRGLEQADIVQMGYAVEYDFVPPQQTQATLETKRIAGLYLAGQINGTSGYEEAAGQGLIAGVNAARRCRDAEPVVLRRDQGYIGVMIDDLVTKGTVEPYRMFTSRAEYRLLLRSDNADARLTPIGREIGLVDDARWGRFERKQTLAAAFDSWASARRHNGRCLLDVLAHGGEDAPGPAILHEWADSLPALVRGCSPEQLAEVAAFVCIEAKYGGYICRQQREIERFRTLESRRIPDDFDFGSLRQLKHEARERLQAVAPRSIGQARRISGISPADMTVLMIYLDEKRRRPA
ncbi:MAG: tRNA uridine-5-carboxymethylaminomethyl(34) synthesis enzyme MnmG [Planctomycetota bacterium]